MTNRVNANTYFTAEEIKNALETGAELTINIDDEFEYRIDFEVDEEENEELFGSYYIVVFDEDINYRETEVADTLEEASDKVEALLNDLEEARAEAEDNDRDCEELRRDSYLW